jgi:putative intracellular protease/amidase/YHS domain-containing protein
MNETKMNIELILMCLLLLFCCFSINVVAQGENAVVSLEGLDPVSLVQGSEVKGNANINVVRGRLKYLFSSEKTKKEFEASPELYEVQNNGQCPLMPGVQGDPDLWQVYKGKIYLFGSPMCRNRFRSSPETILHPEKAERIKVRNVAIVLYQGIELLDFAGPGEVFASARTIEGQRAFNVYTVGASTDNLVSQGFLTIKPQYSFADAPKPDIVIFPGGDVDNFLGDIRSMTWAKAVSIEAEIAMSVCNGAFVLAQSKLLDGKNITTHRGSILELRRQVPSAKVLENIRFVDNGKVITTAGVSAGIDGALHVVERLLGTPAATLTAEYMEYNWQPKK